MPKNFTSVEDFIANDSFVRYCFGDNEKDVIFWENWLENHSGQRENAKKAKKLLYMLSMKAAPDKKLKNWQTLRDKKLSSEGGKSPFQVSGSAGNKFKKIWIAAAIALLIAGAGIFSFWLNTPDTFQGALTFQTFSGEKKQITLPDQTKVWLNADSKLTFYQNAKQFVKREVTLTGEAYFKVQKDRDRPFIIHANALNIEVLGTEFNVSAYSESLTTSATLIRGAIQVYFDEDSKEKIRLKPNEKFTAPNKDHLQKHMMNPQKIIMPGPPKAPDFKITRVKKDPLLEDDDLLETAWLDGKIAFRDENFEELALQLSHKYGVQFHFETPALKAYRFTGIFTKENLSEVLQALQLTSPSHPFKYKIEGGTVWITN